ncbi:Arylsulfatase [Botrimarina hoheduenensis]|uniref:Arylsulfatase n=2 Tax=Botrimarina hoheduenensis TaxID=2528000 RepID=A0A5C5VXE3_9BACT|nr:Arylsulfatase [Botrimarina hoheduenensis]
MVYVLACNPTACIVALVALLSIGSTQASQPNILWIVTDDHRADSVEAYNRATTGKSESPLGYVSSPNIDALASEGVLFTRAFCNSPACGPSRASMITGRYPFRNGKYGWEQTHQEADFARPTVPQVMRDAGYHTAIIGKRHLGVTPRGSSRRGTPTLFDFEIDYESDLERNGIGDLVSTGAYGLVDAILLRKDATETVHYPDGRVKRYTLSRADRLLNAKEHNAKRAVEEEFDILRAYTMVNTGLILGGVNPKPAGETVDAYIVKEFQNHLQHAGERYKTLWSKEVEGADTDKPLFVNLGFHLPHTPVLPPQSFRERFRERSYRLPEFDADELAALPSQLVEAYLESKTDRMRPAEKLQAIRDYYAFAAYGDSLIGQAVDAFKRYSERTGRGYLIVLTIGDHGWHLGEQGVMAKFGPWRQSVSGAAIVVSSDVQRFPPGSVHDGMVEYVDFFPTVAAAGGVDVSLPDFDYLDGDDLAQVVEGQVPEREYILGEMNLVCGHRAYLRTDDFAFSMRTRDRRTVGQAPLLNDDVRWALTCKPRDADLALYDLRADPLERRNVAYTVEYHDLALWFREKLGNIVLGDGRIECDWSLPNSYSLSNFAGGADDKRISIPDGMIPPASAYGQLSAPPGIGAK